MLPSALSLARRPPGPTRQQNAAARPRRPAPARHASRGAHRVARRRRRSLKTGRSKAGAAGCRVFVRRFRLRARVGLPPPLPTGLADELAMTRPIAALTHSRVARSRKGSHASSLLIRAAPPLVDQGAHPRSAQAPSFELARELRDDVPAADYRRLRDRSRESILDGANVARFRWPKRDHVTRTYVNSRSVVRT